MIKWQPPMVLERGDLELEGDLRGLGITSSEIHQHNIWCVFHKEYWTQPVFTQYSIMQSDRSSSRLRHFQWVKLLSKLLQKKKFCKHLLVGIFVCIKSYSQSCRLVKSVNFQTNLSDCFLLYLQSAKSILFGLTNQFEKSCETSQEFALRYETMKY